MIKKITTLPVAFSVVLRNHSVGMKFSLGNGRAYKDRSQSHSGIKNVTNHTGLDNIKRNLPMVKVIEKQ